MLWILSIFHYFFHYLKPYLLCEMFNVQCWHMRLPMLIANMSKQCDTRESFSISQWCGTIYWPSTKPHQAVRLFGCKEVCGISCGCSLFYIQQFNLFMNPFSQKWSSTEKMIFFNEIPSLFESCSKPNQRTINISDCHVTWALSPIELYLPADWDLFAKFSTS